MNLAAMLDLGVEAEFLKSELDKLGISDEFELVVTDDARNGIHGVRVDVTVKNLNHGEATEGEAHSDHSHHSHHAHHSHHSHEHHRNFAAIKNLIDNSSLSAEVKQTSLDIFRLVAEAESNVHAKPVEEVHFHEVGATDSIVDIVGAAICFHRLGVDAVWSSSVELGSGFVQCAHGLIPVPAPATVEILKNVPTRQGTVEQEATTPTGAAIIKALSNSFPSSPVMRINKTGYGIGHRQTAHPNLLRVFLAEVEGLDKAKPVNHARLLQCNIDDMTAEMLGAALDLLLNEGAMDVYFTPVTMKKNRPGTMLSVLCSQEEEQKFKNLLFRHTSTLGVKSFLLDKTTLERSFEKLETSLGTVTLKHALVDGKIYRSKPEFEDCRKIALEHDMSLFQVYDFINRAKK